MLDEEFTFKILPTFPWDEDKFRACRDGKHFECPVEILGMKCPCLCHKVIGFG